MNETNYTQDRLLRPPAWKRSAIILVEREGMNKEYVKRTRKGKRKKVNKSKS